MSATLDVSRVDKMLHDNNDVTPARLLKDFGYTLNADEKAYLQSKIEVAVEPPPIAEAIAAKFVKMGAHVMVTDRGTKRCTTPEWEQKATNDLDAALRLAKTKPNGNIMLVGKKNGVWALDDDAGLVSEYEKIHGPLTTYATRTVSGGRHFIFRQNAASWEMGNISVADENKVELLSARVDNRYVIAAGSWAYPNNDESQPLTQYTAINPDASVVEAPETLLDFIKAKDAEWKARRAKPSENTANFTVQVTEGGRNNHLTTRGGALRNAGASHESILMELRRFNESECVPPLPSAEVESIARSVSSYKEGLPPIRMSSLDAAAPVDVSNWRDQFRSVGEMEDGPIDMIIDGVLQEGTCFIGANPGDGKTLVALAFAKAICTGTPLFGLPQFHVKQPRTVIYLIPESRDRAFRKRCEAFRIPNDKEKFMARTISAGVSLELSDPRLLEAVRQTKAVVFLDTASRFMQGSDENAAAQNRQLVNDVIALLAAGAVCVVLVHHATKAAKANQERMTLENMLRGTSDFGAMCDQAYGLRKDMSLYANGDGPMELELVSLKDREQIGGLTSIRLAASHKSKDKGETFPVSYIDETGNFRVVSDSETSRREIEALETSVKNEPNIPAKELAERFNMSEYRVKSELGRLGWHRVQGGSGGASPWHQDFGSCPFEKVVKPKTVEDAVAYLQRELLGTSPEGEYIPETDILKGADKVGISDLLIGKARKRLGVVVTKEGNTRAWSLPGAEEGTAA